MRHAQVRFFAELNDFLPPGRRDQTLEYAFSIPGSIKDAIESLGVPHTEVDLILVNGCSNDFDYLLQDGDCITVYPVFHSLDVSAVSHVRPAPLEQLRFVLDTHLGRLAAYLRMLGSDARYRNDYQDEELARVSCGENRILLTRDVGLLKRSSVRHGYFLRETNVRSQVVEVVRRFDLFASLKPFRRCLKCNALLQPVAKDEIRSRLPPRTEQLYEEFHRCPRCDRIYWKGSHFQRMRQFIDQVLRSG